MSSLTKDTRIKALEYLKIKLGYDPNNVKATKDIFKKNGDIQALRKQLKLPTTEHPQAKDVTNLEIEKENFFKLIAENNVQLQNMEKDMEALLKEKEQLEKLGTSAANISTQQEVQKTTQASTTYSSQKLVQALGKLALTNKENENLITTLTKVEENNLKEDNAYFTEVQKKFKIMRISL